MKTPARLAAALIVCMLCGVSIASAANSRKSTTPNTGNSQQRVGSPNTLVFNRTLESTSFSFGEDDILVSPFTYTPIDNVLNFTCPFATCTVTAEMHAQLGGNTTDDDNAALCGVLDGDFMSPPGGGNGCPYTGLVRSDGGFGENSFTFVASGVKKGAHTLQGQVFTWENTTLANYSIVYRLYKP